MIIPVIFGGKTVSFVAADMTKAPDKKYKNAPGDINDYIYGYDEIKDGGRIIITEGVLDKWRIGQDAVATLGTHITNRQQRLILDKHPSELIFCYDEDYYLKEIQFNDIPGQFMPFVPKIKIVKFPAGIDPDKYGLVYGKEKLMELINTTEHWGG